MPSHIGPNGKPPQGKQFLPQNQAQTAMEKEIMEIVQNLADKKNLGYSLARLQILEKKLDK